MIALLNAPNTISTSLYFYFTVCIAWRLTNDLLASMKHLSPFKFLGWFPSNTFRISVSPQNEGLSCRVFFFFFTYQLMVSVTLKGYGKLKSSNSFHRCTMKLKSSTFCSGQLSHNPSRFTHLSDSPHQLKAQFIPFYTPSLYFSVVKSSPDIFICTALSR